MIYTEQRHETKNLKNKRTIVTTKNKPEFDYEAYKDCSCLCPFYLSVLETSSINYYSFVYKIPVIIFDYSNFQRKFARYLNFSIQHICDPILALKRASYKNFQLNYEWKLD